MDNVTTMMMFLSKQIPLSVQGNTEDFVLIGVTLVCLIGCETNLKTVQRHTAGRCALHAYPLCKSILQQASLPSSWEHHPEVI